MFLDTQHNDVKKVNSQVNLDKKTGKIVSTPTSNERNIAPNMNDSDKHMSHKLLQLSSSLPDILPDEQQAATKSSSTTTLSSNINNQSQGSSSCGSGSSGSGGHGKHVVLALDADNNNQIDEVMGADDKNQMTKKKIKLNIDPNSSSSASSVNLDFNGDIIVVTDISTS